MLDPGIEILGWIRIRINECGSKTLAKICLYICAGVGALYCALQFPAPCWSRDGLRPRGQTVQRQAQGRIDTNVVLSTKLT